MIKRKHNAQFVIRVSQTMRDSVLKVSDSLLCLPSEFIRAAIDDALTKHSKGTDNVR